MTKLLTMVAGAALLAGVGVASAGEPVSLTDAQMDGVTAGRYCSQCLFVRKKVDVYVDIDGNLADATADADAYGKNTVAEAHTSTFTSSYSSHANSSSLSATDDGRRFKIIWF